jgi:RHS repeat-associated protein
MKCNRYLLGLKLLIVFCFLFFNKSFAQVNLTYNSYNNQLELKASSSVTLLPGFTVPLGSTLRVYIDPINLVFPVQISSLSASQNYVSTRIYKMPGVNNSNLDSARNVSQVNQSVAYFDGLGRPLQTVMVQASPTFKDIVQAIAYDEFGRETTKYLPYAEQGTAGGAYKSNALTSGQGVRGFYSNPTDSIGSTSYPFSRTVFEASPLNRVMEQGAEGVSWQPGSSRNTTPGTVLTSYGTNNISTNSAVAGNNAVRLWTAVPVTTAGQEYKRNLVLSTAGSGLYAANQLYLTVYKDENWVAADVKRGTTEEYKDKEGHVVLKRLFNLKDGVTEVLSTYYVYDDFGNLSFVIPPGANGDATSISADDLFRFVYQYRYDGRQRLIEKKVPGKGWDFIVYNKLDQVVLSQDSVQRMKSTPEWLSTKYDALGRVIKTGIYSLAGGTRTSLQTSVDAQTTLWETETGTANYGYTALTFGLPTKVLTVNYYDDYSIAGLPATNPYNQSGSYSAMTKGLLTASLVNVSYSTNYLWNLNYYDDKGQVVKSVKQHYKGAQTATTNYDEVTNTYNFAGELTASERKHVVQGIENLYINNLYSYDHQGRKIDAWQTTGTNSATSNQPVVLSRNIYNELGQLKTKKLHSSNLGANFAQSIAYRYNQRGWVISQTANLFKEQLRYEASVGGSKAQFNGNISRQEWGTGQYYNYVYDDLDRLRSAIGASGDNEKSIVYDQMGNIQKLQRYSASTLVDQMIYNYNGNKLNSVLDSNTAVTAAFQLPGKTNYVYDGNGNMTSRTDSTNAGNNITSVVYGYLNLPSTMTIGGKTVTYVYDANGTKLRKLNSGNAILNNDYISGIHYEGGNLAFVQTEEGRAVKNGNDFSYEYTLNDHLGNGRVYFDVENGVATAIQATDYYPFGLSIQKIPLAGTENKYQYNGKEKQDELKMLDYGARFYDPVIGRWDVIDAKSELYFQITPYAYAANMPVNAIDPNGHLVIFIAGMNTGNGDSESYWTGSVETVQGLQDIYSTPRQNLNFAGEVRNHFNDKKAIYLDGAMGGLKNTLEYGNNLYSKFRAEDGRKEGANGGVAALINSLNKTHGVITESIKVVAHSMGAAYAKGLIAEIDFAAFQQNKLSAVEGVPLYQYDNENDNVVGGLLGLMSGSKHATEKGAVLHNKNVDPYGGHSIIDFINIVGSLTEGTYKFINGKFVKQ